MRAIRKHAWCAVVAAFGLLLAGCTTVSRHSSQKATVTIGPKGGTYQLGQMTIRIPSGAVASDTKLSLSAPRVVSGKGAAPISSVFRSVGFDLAMTDAAGKPVEPAVNKPLDVQIRLSGDYLPRGANASQALLYTPNGRGSWRLALPSTVQNGVLQATLTHLSPKTIVYLDAKGVKRLLQTEATNAQPPAGGCGKEVTTPATGKVMFGTGNKGWADDGDSPVQPCLQVANNLPQLAVTNRANYILSVSTSARVQVAADNGDLDDSASAFIASKVFGNPVTKTYLARDAVVQAQFDAANLPGKVRLSADPNMVAAESLWKTLKLAVQIVTGDTSNTMLKVAKALLEVQDLQKCMQAANKLPQGQKASEVADSAAEIVVGICGETMANSLAEAQQAVLGFSSANALAGRLKTLFTVAGVIKDTIELIATQIEHDRINGDIDVTLQIAEPPCPSKADVARLYKEYMRNRFPSDSTIAQEVVTTRDGMVCGAGWALAELELKFNDANGNPSGSQSVPLLRFQNGKWAVVMIGTDPMDKCIRYGDQLTGPVKQKLYCQ